MYHNRAAAAGKSQAANTSQYDYVDSMTSRNSVIKGKFTWTICKYSGLCRTPNVAFESAAMKMGDIHWKLQFYAGGSYETNCTYVTLVKTSPADSNVRASVKLTAVSEKLSEQCVEHSTRTYGSSKCLKYVLLDDNL
jgi:hypothetical protein